MLSATAGLLESRAGPWVCAVTSRHRLCPDARTVHDEVRRLRRFVDELVEAGVDLLQIREPDLDAGPLMEVVRGAVNAATGVEHEGRHTLVLVNDRSDVALAAGADGIHLKGASMSASAVRALEALSSPDVTPWIVGRSARATDTLLEDEGLDYWMVGTIFESASKAGLTESAGLAGLRSAVAAARVPVLAIGGMTPDGARQCAAAGAAGVAAIGMFLPSSWGARGAVSVLREAVVQGAREARRDDDG